MKYTILILLVTTLVLGDNETDRLRRQGGYLTENNNLFESQKLESRENELKYQKRINDYKIPVITLDSSAISDADIYSNEKYGRQEEKSRSSVSSVNQPNYNFGQKISNFEVKTVRDNEILQGGYASSVNSVKFNNKDGYIYEKPKVPFEEGPRPTQRPKIPTSTFRPGIPQKIPTFQPSLTPVQPTNRPSSIGNQRPFTSSSPKPNIPSSQPPTRKPETPAFNGYNYDKPAKPFRPVETTTTKFTFGQTTVKPRVPVYKPSLKPQVPVSTEGPLRPTYRPIQTPTSQQPSYQTPQTGFTFRPTAVTQAPTSSTKINIPSFKPSSKQPISGFSKPSLPFSTEKPQNVYTSRPSYKPQITKQTGYKPSQTQRPQSTFNQPASQTFKPSYYPKPTSSSPLSTGYIYDKPKIPFVESPTSRPILVQTSTSQPAIYRPASKFPVSPIFQYTEKTPLSPFSPSYQIPRKPDQKKPVQTPSSKPTFQVPEFPKQPKPQFVKPSPITNYKPSTLQPVERPLPGYEYEKPKKPFIQFNNNSIEFNQGQNIPTFRPISQTNFPVSKPQEQIPFRPSSKPSYQIEVKPLQPQRIPAQSISTATLKPTEISRYPSPELTFRPITQKPSIISTIPSNGYSVYKPQQPFIPSYKPQKPIYPELQTQKPSYPINKPQQPLGPIPSYKPQKPIYPEFQTQKPSYPAIKPQLPSLKPSITPQQPLTPVINTQQPSVPAVKPQQPLAPAIKPQQTFYPQNKQPQISLSFPSQRPQSPSPQISITQYSNKPFPDSRPTTQKPFEIPVKPISYPVSKPQQPSPSYQTQKPSYPVFKPQQPLYPEIKPSYPSVSQPERPSYPTNTRPRIPSSQTIQNKNPTGYVYDKPRVPFIESSSQTNRPIKTSEPQKPYSPLPATVSVGSTSKPSIIASTQKPLFKPSTPPSLLPSYRPSYQPSKVPTFQKPSFSTQIPIIPSQKPSTIPSLSIYQPSKIPSTQIPQYRPSQIPQYNRPSFTPEIIRPQQPSFIPSEPAYRPTQPSQKPERPIRPSSTTTKPSFGYIYDKPKKQFAEIPSKNIAEKPSYKPPPIPPTQKPVYRPAISPQFPSFNITSTTNIEGAKKPIIQPSIPSFQFSTKQPPIISSKPSYQINQFSTPQTPIYKPVPNQPNPPFISYQPGVTQKPKRPIQPDRLPSTGYIYDKPTKPAVIQKPSFYKPQLTQTTSFISSKKPQTPSDLFPIAPSTQLPLNPPSQPIRPFPSYQPAKKVPVTPDFFQKPQTLSPFDKAKPSPAVTSKPSTPTVIPSYSIFKPDQKKPNYEGPGYIPPIGSSTSRPFSPFPTSKPIYSTFKPIGPSVTSSRPFTFKYKPSVEFSTIKADKTFAPTFSSRKPITYVTSTYKPFTNAPFTIKPITLSSSTYKPISITTRKPTIVTSTLKPYVPQGTTQKPYTYVIPSQKPFTYGPSFSFSSSAATSKPASFRPPIFQESTERPFIPQSSTSKPFTLSTSFGTTPKPFTYSPTIKPFVSSLGTTPKPVTNAVTFKPFISSFGTTPKPFTYSPSFKPAVSSFETTPKPVTYKPTFKPAISSIGTTPKPFTYSPTFKPAVSSFGTTPKPFTYKPTFKPAISSFGTTPKPFTYSPTFKPAVSSFETTLKPFTYSPTFKPSLPSVETTRKPITYSPTFKPFVSTTTRPFTYKPFQPVTSTQKPQFPSYSSTILSRDTFKPFVTSTSRPSTTQEDRHYLPPKSDGYFYPKPEVDLEYFK